MVNSSFNYFKLWNIDDITIVDGAIWDETITQNISKDDNLDFAFIMENREAEQMQLQPARLLREGS